MMICLQMIDSPEDKMKFERLYNKYRNLMYNIAYSFLKNEHDAEDAVHQAFVSIIENLEKLSSVESPKTKTFCVIVVERKALNMIRDRKKHADSYDLELEGIPIVVPEETGLPAAMARLSDRYRDALLLRFHLGYTTKEISDILQISHAATLKLIWRAKHELSALLEEEECCYE
jgi:RNA polymerase sigma-70 factor (ECF subfamily)